MNSKYLISTHVKAEAHRLGFALCGMAPATPVEAGVAASYRRWLDEGGQAGMHYLKNHFAKRMDPCLLVPGTRSVVSVAMNYRPSRVAPGIAWYAQGHDYHDLMRQRLTALLEAVGGHGRCFVDTAPVPERYWAWRCGLGWIGHHGQLVVPGQGSAFFLGELFLEEECDAYDTPMADHCGTCTRCLDACPTGAIGGLFRAERCLSYLTIEHRGELPSWAGDKMGEMFYGCDRCLRACPHLHALPASDPLLQPSEALLHMTPGDWQQLTVTQYQALFRGSAVKRAKYEGLVRNIRHAFPPSASSQAKDAPSP